MPISSSQADPDTFENLHFMIVKHICLIKRGFGCKGALMRDLGPSWARFWSPWARMGCSFGAFNASRWQLRFLKIPPNVHNNNFTSQPSIFQKPLFPDVKLKFLKVRVAIQISDTFYERPPYTVIYDGLCHFARVRLRNRFILLMSTLLSAYYLILFFQIVVFPSFGPPRCRF